MVGGVNAAATFAVLPLGALWLLTRSPGPAAAQPDAVVAGVHRAAARCGGWSRCSSWVPTARRSSTSSSRRRSRRSRPRSSTPCAARPTGCPTSTPGSRAGNDLIRDSTSSSTAASLLLLGFAGLPDRRNPHRLFLVPGLRDRACSWSTMGHTGAVQGWFAPRAAGPARRALAPLRNVHKFDVVVRLPLVLGLAWIVDAAVARGVSAARTPRRRSGASAAARASTRARRRHRWRWPCWARPCRSLAGRITPAGATVGGPGLLAAGRRLAGRGVRATALLVPGSSFGEYVWGSPHDEPIQSLGTSPWAVRNAIPLTPAGNIRMLDEIERRLDQGRGSAGARRRTCAEPGSPTSWSATTSPGPATSPTRSWSTRPSPSRPG